MTSVELKERLEKAEAKVEKCKKTIERHEKQAEKKAEPLKRFDWIDLDNLKEVMWDEARRAEYKRETGSDLYWDCCDYNNKIEDIKGAEEKLRDAIRVAQNWREKLANQVAKELLIENEVPEAFKEARANLVEMWVGADIQARDIMIAKRRELEYKAFRKLYTYSAEESLNHTDEEFRKIEEREADMWLLDLYNRVKAITGEVTDCRYIEWGGKSLDGYIIGKDGIADVFTIGAGGYNIQRYHLRVLVKRRA